MSEEALINPHNRQKFLEALNGLDDGDDNLGLTLFGKEISFGRGGDSWKNKPTLRKNMGVKNGTDATSLAVKDLQTKLKDAGYTVVIDHQFGTGTETAVKQFQTNSGLSASGVVDSDTWAVLYGKAPQAERQAKTAQTVAGVFGLGQQILSMVGGAGAPAPTAPPPPPPPEEGPGPNYLLWGGVAVVLLAVVGGGVYFMTRSPEKEGE